MRKILNYIVNGRGRGLKYLMLFCFLMCVIGGGILYNSAFKRIESDIQLQTVLKQMPTLTVEGGKVVRPENTYLFIPFVDGFSDGVVIDTRPDATPDLNFNNGIYITTDKLYVKAMEGVTDGVQVFSWSDVGTAVIDRAFLDKIVAGIVMVSVIAVFCVFLVVLWIGFLFMSITTGIFFWVLGTKMSKGTTVRASVVSWMSVVTINFILLFFGITVQSIPTLFAIGVVLAIGLVFIALKRVPVNTVSTPSGKTFFDTTAPTPEDDKAVVNTPVKREQKTQPVKVASRKKAVKLVEKPRREPAKKTVKK